MATQATVNSHKYKQEIQKHNKNAEVFEQACPLFVPLVENTLKNADKEKIIKSYLEPVLEFNPQKIILGCTHYPLLINKIEKYIPAGVNILSQGALTAASLEDYLKRHPEMAGRITQGGHTEYLTTEKPEKFDAAARLFLRVATRSQRVVL